MWRGVEGTGRWAKSSGGCHAVPAGVWGKMWLDHVVWSWMVEVENVGIRRLVKGIRGAVFVGDMQRRWGKRKLWNFSPL